MTTAATSRVFGDIAIELQNDPDNDVTVSGPQLRANGRPFAELTERGLEILLPSVRAADLVRRGIAAIVPREGIAGGAWVAVGDTSNWLELATEAHDFVGEPRVGGRS